MTVVKVNNNISVKHGKVRAHRQV